MEGMENFCDLKKYIHGVYNKNSKLQEKNSRTQANVNVFNKFQGIIDCLGKKLKNKNRKQCLVAQNLK